MYERVLYNGKMLFQRVYIISTCHNVTIKVSDRTTYQYNPWVF